MSDYDYQNRGGLRGRFSLIPPVIKALIVINAIVFFIDILLSGLNFGGVPLREFFLRYFALMPIDHGFFVWQLISYQFMHGGFWHIFFNLFTLWMFGAELEAMWGSRRFLFFYLLCGVGAGLFQLYISPMFGMVAPTIGASGAVYGVLLAFGLTFPRRPIFMFPIFIPIPAIIYVCIFAGISILMGVGGNDSGVAHFAHIGGAVTGFLLFKFGDKLGLFNFLDRIFKSKKRENSFGSDYYNEPRIYQTNWEEDRRRSERAEQTTRYEQAVKNPGIYVGGEEVTQQKVDEILDKISSHGYQSLSEREKKILFELSQKL